MTIEPTYIYRATLLEVHDGDTYKFDIDLGFHSHQHEWIRLRFYKTPELNEPGGLEAKEAAQNFLMAAQKIVLITQKTKYGDEVMTFSRYVAEVFVDGQNLGLILLNAGVARARPAGEL